MQDQNTTLRVRTALKPLLALLCISLLMLGGVVAATHSHSQGEASHQDCGLCVTAHMAVHVAVTVTQVCVAQVFTRVETSSPVVSHQFIPQSSLFCRPPPADLNRS